jgi:hypothetical protein
MRNPSDAIYKVLTDVVRYAKKNNIKHVIQLGDVFHHPSPSQHDQRRLLKFIENSGLSWYIILGNHDILESGKHSLVMSEFHSEKLPERLRIITKPQVIKIEDVPVCFLPWPFKETLLTSPGITCAHITLKGVRLDSGLRLKDKGVEVTHKRGFWYIGDIHAAQKIEGWGRYVGTPCQRTFGESLPKGFCDCTARIEDGKLKIRDRFVVNKPPYELVNLAVDCADDLDKMKPYDPDDLTLYKLKIQGGFQLPPLFRQQNPHVYDIDYGRATKKPIMTVTGQSAASVVDSDDPLADLESFLKNKGLNEAQVKRGLEKAIELRRRLV